jgi:hypothetical protein
LRAFFLSSADSFKIRHKQDGEISRKDAAMDKGRDR